jgi:hypothetical protein
MFPCRGSAALGERNTSFKSDGVHTMILTWQWHGTTIVKTEELSTTKTSHGSRTLENKRSEETE